MKQYINGYPIIYNPTSKHANRDGYMYEHTFVVEQMLGRELTDTEVIHHRDRNRSNNDINNLIVFSTKAEHTSFHKHNCDESLIEKQEDGTYKLNYLLLNICPLCGGEKDRHSNVCLSCDLKKRNEDSKTGIISRQELKELIRTLPFTKIGEMYGVTDNAIRKVCDKYNLPRRKQDINKYTDSEWNDI